MDDASTAGKGLAATVSGIIGIALYVATGFFYLVSGLVVPAPWLFLLWAIWVAGIYVLVTVFRRARAWTPAVAVAAAVLWWLYVTIGGAFLDWTA